jgi:hypothetical protein
VVTEAEVAEALTSVAEEGASVGGMAAVATGADAVDRGEASRDRVGATKEDKTMPVPNGGHRTAGWGAAAQTTAVAVALSALSAACGPAEGSGPGLYGESVGYGSSSSASASSVGPSQPLVVVVDTDRVLTAAPGQGVGVFTEYRTGGHWHVWWTCDSAVSHDSCAFEIGAAVTGGVIANLQTEGAALQSVVTATPRQVTVSTVTTTELDGITFDTTPGQAIQIDAQLNGTREGQFLFFVQDGIVNGGYTGVLSDPLVLSPSAP